MDEENEKFALPSRVDLISKSWDITEREEEQTTWDFLWNNVTEEGREKQALEEAFTLDTYSIITKHEKNDFSAVAESASKVCLFYYFDEHMVLTNSDRW